MLISQCHLNGPPLELMGPLNPTTFPKPMGLLKSMGPGVIVPPAPPFSAPLTNFSKFELSAPFRSKDITIWFSFLKDVFLESLQGLSIINNVSRSYCTFVTLNKCLRKRCCQNKVKGQNCKLAAFQANSS